MAKKTKRNKELEKLLGPKQVMEYVWEQLLTLEANQSEDVEQLYRDLRCGREPDLTRLGWSMERDRQQTLEVMAALDSLDPA